MSKVVVFTNLTLDGVMQAPARPDEDRRDGFEHGGWATPYAAMTQAGDSMASIDALLLGRRTYEDFYAVWPKRKESPFSAMLDNMQKYVASTTLSEPLPWINSTLLVGDATEAVARLKGELSKDLVIMGSGELVQSLMRRNLIDRYVLLIHPLVLGSGRRLFPDGGAFAALRLVATSTTNNGIVIATYEPTEPAARHLRSHGSLNRMLPARPMKSLELIDTIVRAYELTTNGDPVDLGGSSNLNLQLPGPDGGHVARIYRAWVTPRRLEGIQSVRATLRAAGLPFTQTRPSADGRTFIHFADWLVEVEPFAGGQDMRTWAELLDGMRMLGAIHTVLKGIVAPPGARRAPAANHIGAADAFETTMCACSAIRSWASSPDEERVAKLSEELAQALLRAGDRKSLELPRQLLHGDFWDNNVKFRDGSLAAVLDLDFMEEGARIDDLALVLYYANSGSTLASLRSPLERMQDLRELVDAYDSGLERHLSEEERAALPLVLARTPLKYARHLLLRGSPADQRAVAMAEAPDLEWALSIAKLPDPWRAAFR